MQRLSYKRSGNGHPFVLLHGFLGGSALWIDQLSSFASSHDVICPDLSGFGDSIDLPPLSSIEEHARAVLDLLDSLAITGFDLLGHSMGGMVAQEVARLAPERVRNLVLYGTGPKGILPGRFETIEQSRLRFTQHGVAATGARIAATWFLQGERAEGYELCKWLSAKVRLDTALASLTAWEGWDGQAALPNITARTLVLWGSRDRSYEWSQPEMLWRSIPGADLAVVHDVAHMVHLEKPQSFNSIIAEFCGNISVTPA